MLAQNFRNAALGSEVTCGIAGELSHHDLPVLRPVFLLRRNQHIVVDARVIGNNGANAALLVVATHDFRGASLENFDDLTLATPPIVHARDPCQHLIAIEHLTHLSRAEVQVASAILWDEKPIAVPVADHPTTHQVQLLNKAIGAPTIDQQLAVTFHRAQTAPKRFGLRLILHVQQLTELSVVEGVVGVGQQLKKKFPARNGIFVPFGLALGVRVGGWALLGRAAGTALFRFS